MDFEHTFTFTAKDDQEYLIAFSDNGETVEVFQGDRKLGSVGFLLQEIDRGYADYVSTQYLVQSLNLDNCKRLGIGTEIFRLHKEHYNEPIIARSNDGFKYDDGSHLTGDGLPFIQAMRKKGYVEPEPSFYDEDEDYYNLDD